MEEKQLTVEDIEKKQRLLAILFKVFIAVMILIACVFAGWLISFISYASEIIGVIHNSGLAEPLAKFAGSPWLG
ncbi:hypothetical protein KQI65_10480 [bacterium]|nr:hypothetical protein [bacterium]